MMLPFPRILHCSFTAALLVISAPRLPAPISEVEEKPAPTEAPARKKAAAAKDRAAAALGLT